MPLAPFTGWPGLGRWDRLGSRVSIWAVLGWSDRGSLIIPYIDDRDGSFLGPP